MESTNPFSIDSLLSRDRAPRRKNPAPVRVVVSNGHTKLDDGAYNHEDLSPTDQNYDSYYPAHSSPTRSNCSSPESTRSIDERCTSIDSHRQSVSPTTPTTRPNLTPSNLDSRPVKLNSPGTPNIAGGSPLIPRLGPLNIVPHHPPSGVVPMHMPGYHTRLPGLYPGVPNNGPHMSGGPSLPPHAAAALMGPGSAFYNPTMSEQVRLCFY